jgi:lipid II:glycine glycyltransferase (peptidoglycan interpeptide bridge formation enzyme)
MKVREALPEELEDWDAWAVDRPGGDVHQSRAWAEYRSRWGWRPRYLVFDDGFRLLSLERPWPLLGGSSAYLSRGPISAGEPPDRTAARLQVAVRHLVGVGVDVIATDAEIEAATGYPALIQALGFRQIEEVQPSRHRMSISIAGLTEETAEAGFSTTARQYVRYALRAGLTVVRHDRRAGSDPGEGLARPEGDPDLAAAAGFERLWRLLQETSVRRGFRVGTREQFLDWCTAGHTAGHVVLLEVVAPDGGTLGAGIYHRHGTRLTYSHGGDSLAARETVRGVAQLQTWRAIQLAIREGRAEMDLGGADVRGARREPRPEEEMYGLYQHKRMYGARWIEMTGNHEYVARPWRYVLGRVITKVKVVIR